MKEGLITELIVPEKIVFATPNVSNTAALLCGRESQIGLCERECCLVSGKGYIVLDFGKEYSGGARILTFTVNAPTAAIRLRFGESLSEAYSETGEKGSCNDHSLRDFNIALTSYSDMTFGQTGFRFLRIDFLTDAVIFLKNVYCNYTHREFPAPVPFYSSDKKINDIYAAAKRTIELCCQEYLWDGIKRDRLVWIGDIHPEMLALTSLYGRCGIIEKSLDFTVGQTPLGEWMDDMPAYSAWWVIITADYAEITGAFDYAARHINYVKGLISQFNAHVKDNGELDLPSYFVDWPTHGQPDEKAGCRAILIIMANAAEKLLSFLGHGTDEVETLKTKLAKIPLKVKSAKQVIALKYLATGELDAGEKAKLIEGGAKGMSAFMSYYVLKAVAETVSEETAVSMMREYYGAMLDKGATTFFEDFDMEWVENSCSLDALPIDGERDIHGDFGKYCYTGFRHSFCHGWSSGVIKFLYEHCNEKN